MLNDRFAASRAYRFGGGAYMDRARVHTANRSEDIRSAFPLKRTEPLRIKQNTVSVISGCQKGVTLGIRLLIKQERRIELATKLG